MMMTKHRLSSFSICTFLFLIASCSSIKTILVFEGSNGEGKHTRALAVMDTSCVIAGLEGAFTHYDKQFNAETGVLEGAEDIRDVQILPDGSIIYMNSGENGKIWKQYPDSITKLTFDRAGVFLDGMDFWDANNGMAYGDPVNGKFVMLRTIDGGDIWRPLDYNLIPFALPNEAGFAASGTGIATVGNATVYIATGMADTARLYCSYDAGLNWIIKPTPIKSGDTYGIYSMFFWSEQEGIVVGGSYKQPDDTERLCYYTKDGGENWTLRNVGLGGYTSCIHGTKDGSFLVATGRVATFYSVDKGINWKLLFDDTYYTVHVTADRLYFSGKDGRFSVYRYTVK